MKQLLATVLLATAAISANAAIIYNIDRTIDKGTVTGFIETDGTTGVLKERNILDWSITLTAPNIDNGSPDTFNILGGDTILRGSSVEATETKLTFDFTVSGNNFFLLSSDTTGNFWCLETGLCSGADYSEQMGRTKGGAVAQFQDYSGEKIVFATVVPVPAAVWLFGTGLVVLLGIARSKK